VQVDSLLHLHDRREWTARKGAHGNPAEGSGGPKRRQQQSKSAPPLIVPVPPGTLVKSKKGKVLAELLQIGESFCLCTGGPPGRGVVALNTAVPPVVAATKKERILAVRPLHTILLPSSSLCPSACLPPIAASSSLCWVVCLCRVQNVSTSPFYSSWNPTQTQLFPGHI
jgi:hypothetical protein